MKTWPPTRLVSELEGRAPPSYLLQYQPCTGYIGRWDCCAHAEPPLHIRSRPVRRGVWAQLPLACPKRHLANCRSLLLCHPPPLPLLIHSFVCCCFEHLAWCGSLNVQCLPKRDTTERKNPFFQGETLKYWGRLRENQKTNEWASTNHVDSALLLGNGTLL